MAPSLSVPPPPARASPGLAHEPAPPAATGKLSTGVPRLDSLLGGGYTLGCATLLYGPPFCGKQNLQRHAIVQAALSGTPTTILLHTVGAEAMSRRLNALDPRIGAAEASGLVRYVDLHSLTVGEPTGHPHTVYVADPRDLGELLQAVERPREGPARDLPAGLLAIESASTLLVDLGGERAFIVLRTVLGRHINRGGVALLGLEAGIHAEPEVQMAKHLCTGMIEMQKKWDDHRLHVEGLETAFARPGWIDYEFTPRTFRLTGGFATKTIR